MPANSPSVRSLASGPTRWAILTGEYPPQPGGVADYTALVARGLAAAGDEVGVFAPACAFPDHAGCGGVSIVRLPDHYGVRGLATLDRALARFRPDRLLIQYVPHAFGWKAMNLPFAFWVAARARRFAPVWVMFHEVGYPILPGQPYRHAVLGRANRLMARLLVESAARVFVSIPAWAQVLQQTSRKYPSPEWLPVPTNLPAETDEGEVAALRRQVLGSRHSLVGHLGTYRGHVAEMLREIAPRLLQDDGRCMVLVGRGGEAFANGLLAQHPHLLGRLRATGGISGKLAATYLAACDLLVQPYPDGVSSRRGSMMAGLALGRPVITCSGNLTEPVWTESGAVAIAPDLTPQSIVSEAEKVLANPALLEELGRRGKSLYQRHFDVRRTIEILLAR